MPGSLACLAKAALYWGRSFLPVLASNKPPNFFIFFHPSLPPSHIPFHLLSWYYEPRSIARCSNHRQPAMSKTFTQSDVASNNKADSLWIVVDGDVYDLTKFQDDHPGM